MATKDTIREILITDLRYQGSSDTLTDEYHLIDNHVIDSLDMLKLVSLIEERFDVEIDDEDLVPDNFGTIGSIAGYVETKRAS
jgi:acyl carrier protein